MQQAHAAYYLALAEEAEPKLESWQQDEWLQRLDRDHENLRAVLAWSLEPGQGKQIAQFRVLGLRLAGALRWFWIFQGYLNEGRIFLERALELSLGAATAGRAKALIAAADLAFVQGATDAILPLAEEALILCQKLEDKAGVAFCHHLLGSFYMLNDQYVRARSLLEESVALHRGLGNKFRLSIALVILGGLERTEGEYIKARTYYEEALALWREVGIRAGVAEMLIFLAGLLFASQWDLAKAHSFIDEGLTLIREVSQSWFNKGILVIALYTSAEIALGQNNLDVARSQAQEALALLTEIKKERQGTEGEIAWTLSVVAQVEAHQGNYTAAQNHYDEILTIAREINDKGNLPIYLKGLAEVAAMQGELMWAARLLGAAELLLDRADFPLPPVYQTGHERAVAAVSVRLGEQAFSIARAEGRSMTIEQVLGAPGRETASISVSRKEPAISPAKGTSASPAGLTAREVEVLRLVAQGHSAAQVAEQLVISSRTVNTHLTSIYNKLGVESRTAATRYAVDHHLI